MFTNTFKILSSNNRDFISSRVTYPASFPNQKNTYSLIVACHGIFTNKYNWDGLLETYIKNNYIFVDMDLRGFGLSDGSFPPISSSAKDVLILTCHVCNKLKNYYDPKRVTLMGFSLGGMVVIQALSQPNPFTSCILLSPFIPETIYEGNKAVLVQRYFIFDILTRLNGRSSGDEMYNLLKYDAPNASIVFTNNNVNKKIPLYIVICSGDSILYDYYGVEYFLNNQNEKSVLHVYQGDHGIFEFEKDVHHDIMRWLDDNYEHKISFHISSCVTINYLNIPELHMCSVSNFRVSESIIPFACQVYALSHILRYYFKTDFVLPRYLWDLCGVTYVRINTSSLASFILRLVLVADVRSQSTVYITFLFLVLLIGNTPQIISYAKAGNIGKQQKIEFSVPYCIVEPNSQLYLISTRASTMFSPIVSQGINPVTSSFVWFENCHLHWETRTKVI